MSEFIGDSFFVLLLLVFGIYLLARLTELSEKTKINQRNEEMMREAIRKAIQKRRIDDLYGRNNKKEE